MADSTSPVPEQPDWHPVHRANALLREALQSTTQSFETLEARYSVESLSNAIESVMQGPVHITYPTPLTARLDDLAVEEKTIPGLEALLHPVRHGPGFPLTDCEDDGEGGAGTVEHDETPSVPPPDLWVDPDDGLGLDDPETLRADDPLDPGARALPRQVHMQTLLGEFRRRQRYASLLVTVSIATAVLLTVGGFVLAASLAAPRPSGSDGLAPVRSTSVVWQRPAPGTTGAGLQLAVVSANRAAKGEPLPVPAQAGTPNAHRAALSSAPPTILAASGRQIAFGPLLPPSHARYLLIRGLPPEATLSSGRQSGRGAWLVKGENVPDLSLSLGRTAAGDYPVEVYILESGDGPQARRNFVLRVAPPDPASPASPGQNLTAASDIVPGASAGEEPNVPAEPAVLRDRTMRLLGEGDIAGARLLLLHLAERGDGEAAYDLARTFDREVLAALGAKGLDGDPARARGWYERASQDGNAKAAERLKVLASLSGTGPSD